MSDTHDLTETLAAAARAARKRPRGDYVPAGLVASHQTMTASSTRAVMDTRASRQPARAKLRPSTRSPQEEHRPSSFLPTCCLGAQRPTVMEDSPASWKVGSGPCRRSSSQRTDLRTARGVYGSGRAGIGRRMC